MSKEAVGQMGTKIGSSEYWYRVNRSTLLGNVMGSNTHYQTTLRALGTKAAEAIEEIYRDLEKLGTRIRFLPSADRNVLAKQVEGLYDICKMGGVIAWRNNECVQGLTLSCMSPWTRSFLDERGIETAISIIKKSPYSGSEAVNLLREAAKWSVSSAAGWDPKKRVFLEAVEQGKGSRFLLDVAEEYENQNSRPRYEGSCGHTVASRSYLAYMEAKVFGTQVSTFGDPDYEPLLRDALSAIAGQLERDLDSAIRENDYITDETAGKLKAVVSELDHCGVSTGGLTGKIEKLAWFVGGDPAKIKELQKALNDLSAGQHLEEDGVYGEKTQSVWLQFIRELETGTVPTLCWVDILQSEKTHIEIGATEAGKQAGLNNALVYGKNPYIRIDAPHSGRTGGFRGEVRPIDYNHINFGNVKNSNGLYKLIQKKYNHYPLDDRAYNALKDLKSAGKKVRVAGKVLLIGGLALDALELGIAVNTDLKDADKKLGKTTASTAASIGGSWAGAALLAKSGATIGLAAGVAAPVAIPVLSIAGGIIGSIGGSKLAQYIIDITYVED